MRRQWLALIMICAFCALSGLSAYAQAPGVKVSVPFNFLIGDHPYPAGDYVFSARKENVLVQRAGGAWGVMVLANRVTGRDTGSSGRVIFQCYEQQCFLSQLWIPGLDEGRAPLSSPHEKKVARRSSGVYMALMGKP
jgi:hypothetical protein